MRVCRIDRVGVYSIWRSAISICHAVLPQCPPIDHSLTLRGIHNGLEHQRNECNEEKIIDEELRCAPERSRCILGNGIGASIFRGERSRVSGSVGRSGGGRGKTSVEGIERVQASEPGEKGRHFIAGAWRTRWPIETEGLGGIERMYGVGVYLESGCRLRGAEALPTGHWIICPRANHSLRMSPRSITISMHLLTYDCIPPLQVIRKVYGEYFQLSVN